MPDAIHDIIKLTGGVGRLSRLEIQPEGQPVLVIKATRRDARGVVTIIDVTIGDFMTFRFRLGPRYLEGIVKWPYQCEGYWPPRVDEVLRKNGYIEAAIQYHLQPT